MSNPKQIPDPDNEDNLIDNPDYDPSKNEDGTPIEEDDEETKKQKEKDALDNIQKDKVKKAIDEAYKARDEAIARAEALEKREREAEKEKLKEQGKLSEVHVIELAEKDAELNKRDARIKDLEKELTKLTRDASVKDILSVYEFRSPKARDVAVSDITKLLKKNEDGEWTAKDGRPIEDLAKAYLDDAENTWLLKPKQSTGAGLHKTKPGETDKKKSGSLFGLSQAEVFDLARKGQLPKRT